MTDAVTILRAHDSKRLCKQFTLATNGVVRKIDFDSPTWFAAETVPVQSIDELHSLLTALEADPHACIVRGGLADGIDARHVRRKKKGTSPALIETPRRWIMADFDDVPVGGASVLDDPADAARRVLDILLPHAPELDGVSAIVQFSSSAGLDELAAAEAAADLPARWHGVAKRGLSAHVWFWLNVPTGEAELKRWAKGVNASAACRLIDDATIRTVQPHYTAAPIFHDPLRDPLVGRRTVLVRDVEDAATLVIPAEPPRITYVPGQGSTQGGRGYAGFLDDIGGLDGFRGPILRAVTSFVATTWPNGDFGALKGDIRNRIASADPGGRSAATIANYASDGHLDSMIAWAVEREAEKMADREAEAAKPVAPTFPDRGVSLDEAQNRASKTLAAFTARVAAGGTPAILLQVTTGGGKTDALIRQAPSILQAARAAGRGAGKDGRKGAFYIFVPRHDLAEEMQARLRRAHPGLRVVIWRGMDRLDPLAPADDLMRNMCRDRELSGSASAAFQGETAGCVACPFQFKPDQPNTDACGYTRQRSVAAGADVILLMHNALFQDKPAGLPKPAVLAIDESFMSCAVEGVEKDNPIQLALSALDDDRTGPLTGLARERLLFLRRRARDAIAAQEDGGLMRQRFIDAGFGSEALSILNPATADELVTREWDCKPVVKVTAAMTRDDAIAAFSKAAEQGFTTLRPVLATRVRELVKGTDARSVNATLVRNVDLGRNQGTGDVVRFVWRRDFAAWIENVPAVLLDATTHPTLLAAWVPSLEVTEIEVAAPLQHVRQIIGAEFGRAKFTSNPVNVGKLADLVVVELAEAAGAVLVIAQAVVETLLERELVRRFGEIPARLHLAHHGAITGLNLWERVERAVIVGRPALNRLDGERLAEIIHGSGLGVVADGDASLWPTVPAGIRLADGTGRVVRQPRHPDPKVESVRWTISEGAVLQAIGRPRGVRRPVQITLMAELALPITVAAVETWDQAQPDRVTVAAAEAAILEIALPLAPADLHHVRPDLWPSVRAAELGFERSKNPQPLIYALNKRLRGFTPARYRKAGARRWSAALVPLEAGRLALETALGCELAGFELVDQPATADLHVLAAPAPFDPLPDVLPPADPEPPEVVPDIAAARAALADLSRRLELLRPPRMWGDSSDELRVSWWRQRVATLAMKAREAA